MLVLNLSSDAANALAEATTLIREAGAGVEEVAMTKLSRQVEIGLNLATTMTIAGGGRGIVRNGTPKAGFGR